MIAANFDRRDLVVTLTYDDAHLPQSRAEAVKNLKKFFRALRGVRRRQGLPELKYIYVTEGFHEKRENDWLEGDGSLEDRRLHHHVVINTTGIDDLEEIRSLWQGGGYIRAEPLDVHYYRELAKYMTKEAREYGKQLGKKTWVSSRGLKRPVQPKAEVVPDLMTLTVPPNADPLESSGGEVRLGEFGCYAWIKYIYRDPEDYRLPREVSGDPEEDLTAWRRERPKPTTPYKN